MVFCRYTFTNTTGKATIVPIPDGSVHIGQRQGLSNLDVAKINKLYNCSKYLKATLSIFYSDSSQGCLGTLQRQQFLIKDCEAIVLNSWYPLGLLWERMQR